MLEFYFISLLFISSYLKVKLNGKSERERRRGRGASKLERFLILSFLFKVPSSMRAHEQISTQLLPLKILPLSLHAHLPSLPR